MTRPRLHLSLSLLILAFACKKPEEIPIELPDPKAPPITITIIPGTQATLQATYFSTLVDSGFVGEITFVQGWGKAIIKSENGAFLRPAMVSAEGVQLKESKGVFSNSPGSSFGIDFGSAVNWEVSSTPASPAFTETLLYKVPEIGDLNIGDTMYTGKPLRLIIDLNNAFTNLGPVDSITYQLSGRNGKAGRRISTLDTVTFTTSELGQLGKGKGYIQAEAFRYEVKTYGTYKVAFVNKGIINKEIWIY